MPATRRVGRPRSEGSRDAVLKAATQLMLEVGPRRMTVDAIAHRSGVSKATIYKWWPNKSAVAIEAYLGELMVEAPDPDTGSAYEDLRLSLRGIMHFYSSPSGRVFAQLVGEAQFDPDTRKRLREFLVESRRGVIKVIWDRGVDRGELDPDVDPAVAMDLIFGAAMYRMAIEHGGLEPADADAILSTAMRALKA
ncbi:MAG: transcriptional regulator [Mycobacterium sp.]|nr:transcriptional regulator [Mycobacterium sp.]